jgi:hypothetical protein
MGTSQPGWGTRQQPVSPEALESHSALQEPRASLVLMTKACASGTLAETGNNQQSLLQNTGIVCLGRRSSNRRRCHSLKGW